MLTPPPAQLNCNHEFFPDMALAQASELDEHFARHNKPVGPLHGLPVSLKDQCRIKASHCPSLLLSSPQKLLSLPPGFPGGMGAGSIYHKNPLPSLLPRAAYARSGC